MRQVRIEGNVVAEIGYFESPIDLYHPSLIWIASDTAEVGDVWNGSEFTPPPKTVPKSVTMRQARLALLGAEKLAAVDAAIASLPIPQKEAAQIEWEYASEIQRGSALIAQLAPALDLTETQMDDLFIAASGL